MTEEADPASSSYLNAWAGPGMIREADETLGQLPALTLAVGTEDQNRSLFPDGWQRTEYGGLVTVRVAGWHPGRR